MRASQPAMRAGRSASLRRFCNLVWPQDGIKRCLSNSVDVRRCVSVCLYCTWLANGVSPPAAAARAREVVQRSLMLGRS